MMTTNVPQYYENRMVLTEMDGLFEEFVGGPTVVDIGETLRVMLGDYFYSEPPIPNGYYYTDQDRTIVFARGAGYALQGQDLAVAIDALGEVFWTLADLITNRMLRTDQHYTHRPNECFYRFFPATRELVVYTPVMMELFRPDLVALDGRAVMVICAGTLPSWLRNPR